MFPRSASLVLPLTGIAILSIALTTPGAAAEHGYLGMVLQRLEDGILRVLSVQAGGPAERAGIRPGDLVLRIDGREARAKTDRDIVELVRPIEAGQAVKIELDTLTVVARDDGRLERLEPGEAVTARIRLDEKTNRLVVELRDR